MDCWIGLGVHVTFSIVGAFVAYATGYYVGIWAGRRDVRGKDRRDWDSPKTPPPPPHKPAPPAPDVQQRQTGATFAGSQLDPNALNKTPEEKANHYVMLGDMFVLRSAPLQMSSEPDGAICFPKPTAQTIAAGLNERFKEMLVDCVFRVERATK